MKRMLMLWMVVLALAACGGGGSSEPAATPPADDGGGGEVPAEGGGGGGYAAAPATDYVHVYQIVDIEEPVDPLADDLITLDDGSVWRVTMYDYRLFMWMDFQDVVVCGLPMFNLDREESVHVSWNGGPTADACPVYSVSEILDNGELLKLSDGSYWEISSFDTFDTRWWNTIVDDIVITDTHKIVNLDQEEIVDGTRLN